VQAKVRLVRDVCVTLEMKFQILLRFGAKTAGRTLHLAVANFNLREL
jgi:hypothetical protein